MNKFNGNEVEIIHKERSVEGSNEINHCLEIKQIICRICLGDSSENIISPCRCSGTSQYCHQECLKKWIQQKFTASGVPSCGVCKEDYKILPNFKYKITFKRDVKERNCYLSIIINIIFVILGIAITIFFVVSNYFFEVQKEIAAAVITLTLCIIGIIAFIVLLIMVFKHGFYFRKVKDVMIMNYFQTSNREDLTIN